MKTIKKETIERMAKDGRIDCMSDIPERGKYMQIRRNASGKVEWIQVG